MAELISRCAALRAAGDDGDGDAWVDAARALGGDPAETRWREALERHSARVARVIFDAVSDGKHVLYGMLITALIFCAVIAIGELTQLGRPSPRRAQAPRPRLLSGRRERPGARAPSTFRG